MIKKAEEGAAEEAGRTRMRKEGSRERWRWHELANGGLHAPPDPS